MACPSVNFTLCTRVGAHVLTDNVLEQWTSSIAEKRPKMGCRVLQGTISVVQKQSMVFTAVWQAAVCIASSGVQAFATK